MPDTPDISAAVQLVKTYVMEYVPFGEPAEEALAALRALVAERDDLRTALADMDWSFAEMRSARDKWRSDYDEATARLRAERAEAVAALRELSEWSLPRWEPDNPQTEGEEMRLFAIRWLMAHGAPDARLSTPKEPTP